MSKIFNTFLLAVRTISSVKNSKYLGVKMSQEKSSNNSILDSAESFFNRYQKAETNVDNVFQGVTDRFNGITIDSNEENCDSLENFKLVLDKSLRYWTENKKRGIWFKVRHKNADWVPILATNDFNFHHAKDDFVMMYKWLPKDEALIIPPYSHTMVGVGAVVLNDKNEILVVSEKNALIPGSWKLPGGYLERNENIEDAAIREVYEETNIQTTLDSLVSIRHAHGAGFGCSDLYLVFALKPLSTEIKKCEREIANCCWMPLDEYLKHPNVHQTNRSFVQQYLYNREHGISIVAEDGTHQILKKKYKLYFARKN